MKKGTREREKEKEREKRMQLETLIPILNTGKNLNRFAAVHTSF